ncbi:transcription antitermination factor NusB [bacterium]|nr:transcription antitermination factor NusB [bacterium]
MTRRNSRELALQVLFQREFMPQASPEELLSLYKQHLALGGAVVEYSKTLVKTVIIHQEKIDQLIQKYSVNWNIKRFSLVDLNILRLAVCEMLFLQDEAVPSKSVINEAIEISKKYSSLESPAFINGILDQIFNKETGHA